MGASNLILTGFMGTGKSAVGREVARRLGRSFVDMDAEIEARAGKSIPRIFAECGEAAFREMEGVLCKELSMRDNLVISTGGGTLVDPENRALMMANGLVVCLNATPEAILRRVGHKDARPLLDVDDPRAEIERLLTARREAYTSIPWQIDTTDLSVAECAERVISIAEAKSLSVRYPGGAYEIRIGTGMLAHVGGALRAAGLPIGTRLALVSNDVVAPLYAERAEDSLRVAGLRPFRCVIPDGEQHKTLATVHSLYDQFLAAGLDRSGMVLSLGGGVTGDIAGFAAATFMRGVPFAQVPTTVLAMVDASVGGKTGVDLPQGKNLVGAFKQPLTVVIDPAVLDTLEEAEFRSGMAELIKHGVIADPELFALVGATRPDRPTIDAEVIAQAVRVKIDVVEDDPFEHGRRATLNLGHTVGHALEKLSGFELRHGEAVSIGMVAAACISVELGLVEPALVERIEATLAAWELPVRCPPFDRLKEQPFKVEAIWQAMAHDKKRQGDNLRWVLPRAIGEVEIIADVPPSVVKAVLRELGATVYNLHRSK